MLDPEEPDFLHSRARTLVNFINLKESDSGVHVFDRVELSEEETISNVSLTGFIETKASFNYFSAKVVKADNLRGLSLGENIIMALRHKTDTGDPATLQNIKTDFIRAAKQGQNNFEISLPELKRLKEIPGKLRTFSGNLSFERHLNAA